MIKPEQVPEEVWRALGKELGFIQHRDAYCTAIAAALSAWHGMTHMEPDLANGIIILPLTEASDGGC